MLTGSLLPKFFWEHARIEPALCLKAIYFDSGVVRTPEQAIGKAYDLMPGIERPDFVPGELEAGHNADSDGAGQRLVLALRPLSSIAPP